MPTADLVSLLTAQRARAAVYRASSYRAAPPISLDAFDALLSAAEALVDLDEHPTCAAGCSSFCDDDTPGMHTDDGPDCRTPAHWKGAVHIACSCGWADALTAGRAALRTLAGVLGDG